MSDYNELYQQIILEHNKKPRNFKVLDSANAYALGKNPLCGDQFAVYTQLDADGKIEDIGFQGDGCAIAKASASLMTNAVKGKSREEALQMREEFQQLLRGELDESTSHHLGRLTILSGVREYPVRVKCATLAWHTLGAALQGQSEATTE
ncbi:iron-sulfur cluster assembly scaffold protein [Microcystis phage MaAM05]|nr:iron-sulfur cluster assembly scaffold protein [Microcystis phage MaAM05]